GESYQATLARVVAASIETYPEGDALRAEPAGLTYSGSTRTWAEDPGRSREGRGRTNSSRTGVLGPMIAATRASVTWPSTITLASWPVRRYGKSVLANHATTQRSSSSSTENKGCAKIGRAHV